jgi:hypothetical protein
MRKKKIFIETKKKIIFSLKENYKLVKKKKKFAYIKRERKKLKNKLLFKNFFMILEFIDFNHIILFYLFFYFNFFFMIRLY